MGLRWLVLALALAGVLAYDAALPLWEGWDEPFHYGYVQAIRSWGEIPVMGRTPLSKEIEASLFLTPLPPFLSGAVPGSISFAESSKADRGQRGRRRDQLLQIPATAQTERSNFRNYEAQQAPLAYILLAPLDAALKGVPLVPRVFRLRVVSSIAGLLLTFFALLRLLDLFGLDRGSADVALCCIVTSQTLSASISHIDNDWLAIPLTIWLMVLVGGVARHPGRRNAFAASLVLALGLLTKAYFLAFAPVLLALLVFQASKGRLGWLVAGADIATVLGLGAPWYARNLILYGSLAGTQESVRGTPLSGILHAIVSVNWPRSGVALLRSSLWCGNWSFTPFPKGPLNAELVLLLSGLLLLAWRPSKLDIGVRWYAAAWATFAGALVYQTCSAWVDSRGALSTTEPWYIQGLLPGLWAAAFAGIKGRGWVRFCVATPLLCLAAGISAVGYLRFLIPGYASGNQRPTLSEAWAWWTAHPTSDLQWVAVAPPFFVYALLGIYCSLLLAVTVSGIWKISPSPSAGTFQRTAVTDAPLVS